MASHVRNKNLIPFESETDLGWPYELSDHYNDTEPRFDIKVTD